MSLRLVAVVLAGGEGSRMGGRKPLRPWGEGTLIDQALRQARGYAPCVAVSVRREDQLEGQVEVPLLLDDAEIAGPLGGLAAALGFAREEKADAVLTLPCDTPRLPADLAERLVAALERGAGLVAVAMSCGQLHPTCGLWRTEAEARLMGYAAEGRRSLKGLAEALGAGVADWGAVEPDPFTGANTPAELRALSEATPVRPRRGPG